MRGTPINSVDVVLFTPHGRHLAILLVPAPGARERWSLPWADARGALDATAGRVAHDAAGVSASWIAQAGAFADGARHPGGAAISVAYIGVTPAGADAPPHGARWFAAAQLPPLAPRHRAIADAALTVLRESMDRAPVAFKLLGSMFTLGDLQSMYEILLGRRLHKASFRRALAAASLVEPTDEWRSEGRGRPAQLFRYAPKVPRGGRGGVRFGLLSE